jgi:hypothetical protein
MNVKLDSRPDLAPRFSANGAGRTWTGLESGPMTPGVPAERGYFTPDWDAGRRDVYPFVSRMPGAGIPPSPLHDY